MMRLNRLCAAVLLVFAGLALILTPPGLPRAHAERATAPIDRDDAVDGARVATSADQPDADQAAPVARRDPKPLTDHVHRGLAWLIAHQGNDGGWGQGEESAHMGDSMNQVRDVSNVADTAMAVLALHRAGSTPSKGPHARAVARGVAFVCESIEAADADSLWVTDVRGTRLQGKIGQYVDTFVAALMLAEVTQQMPDDAGNARVAKALDKVVLKIEKNQRDDGRFDGQGWAAGLGGGMGVKALNRAAQRGADVDMDRLFAVQDAVRDRSSLQSDGIFGDTGANAGIELYAAATEVGELNDYSRTNRTKLPELQQAVAEAQSRDKQLKTDLATAKAEGADAPQLVALSESIRENEVRLQDGRAELSNIEQTEEKLAEVRAAALRRFDDPQFVAGFGNNGGEEFLSYLQVGEALATQGGPDFLRWDQDMTENLNRIQNQDGSWSGHHCITGRTFCTSAALLVLTVDRADAAVAAMGQDR